MVAREAFSETESRQRVACATASQMRTDPAGHHGILRGTERSVSVRLSNDRRHVGLRGCLCALHFSLRVDLRLSFVNGVRKRASISQDAMLSDHKRQTRIASRMGDRCKFLGASETLGRDRHSRPAIEQRFPPVVQPWIRQRDHHTRCRLRRRGVRYPRVRCSRNQPAAAPATKLKPSARSGFRLI
jgi:hypothetical protein